MNSPATATTHTEFLVSRGAVLDASKTSAAHFGDPERESAAFADSAALIDRAGACCLIQEGEDALDLLHRLTTNDLLSLQVENARFTVLTSERGRIIDVLHVAHIGAGKLLLLSESSNPEQAIDWIDKFTIIEDSEIRDASDELARLAIIGPNAFQVAKSVFGVNLTNARASLLQKEKDGTVLISSEWAGTERVDVITPSARLATMWDRITDAGAVPAGDVSFQAVRIKNGVPLAGFELTEDSNPLEVRLKEQISFTKGCYVGQEVVARLDTYDKLQKRLVKFESDSALTAGEVLRSDGKRAGTVTSVSPFASGHRFEALGFARRDFWTDGTVLETDGGAAVVKELGENSPFI